MTTFEQVAVITLEDVIEFFKLPSSGAGRQKLQKMYLDAYAPNTVVLFNLPEIGSENMGFTVDVTNYEFKQMSSKNPENNRWPYWRMPLRVMLAYMKYKKAIPDVPYIILKLEKKS